MAASDIERDALTAAGMPQAAVADLLHNIATLIAEAEHRQGIAMRELQERLESLSRQAGSVRAQVPEEYVPAFERIEDGLDQIATRLSRSETERLAGRHQSSPASQQEPVAEISRSEATELAAATRSDSPAVKSPSGPPNAPAPAALLSAVEPVGSLRGSLRPDAGRGRPQRGDVDTFDIVDSTEPGNPDEPWDGNAAEALTRVYESLAEATRPLTAPGATAAPADDDQPAPAMAAAFAPHLAALQPESSATPALDVGRDWLEARFAEIASRVEQSLAELRHDSPAVSLDSRLDQFESRFGQVLQDMATRGDHAGMHDFEAQLDDLTQHVEQAHLQLQRLDTIEAQLNTVMEKLSDQRLSEILEQTAPGHVDIDVDRIAQAAAEQVAQRLAQVAPAPGASPADVRRLDELRELINSFIAERRQGEEHTVGMLDTMQQAMMQLLDRVDALELSGQASHETYATEPGVPPPAHPAEETVASTAPAQPKAQEPTAPTLPMPAGAEGRPGGRISDVTRDQLIAEARRAMQLAAAKREAEAQLEAEAAKADPKAKLKSDKSKGERLSLAGGVSKSGRRIMVGAVTLLLLSSAAVMLLMPRKPNPNANPNPAVSGNPAQPKVVAPQASAPAAAKASAAPQAPADPMAGRASPGTPQVATPQDQAAPASSGIPKAFLPKTVPESNVDSLSHEQDNGPDRAVIQEASSPAPFPGITFAPQATAAAPVAAPRGPERQQAKTIPVSVPAGESGTGSAIGGVSEAVAGRSAPAEMPPLTIGPSSLRQAAAKGDPSAEFEVAARFAEGKGVQQNFQQALRWYQRSASQGFAASQYRLGTLYERGLGTKADAARARIWYQRAAEQGHVKAMHNLAVMATAKDLAKPDYSTAAQWFKEAAERGLADSQYNLAVLHESGLGVPKDIQQAYKWYSAARVQGDKEAGRRLDMLRAKIGAAEIALGEALAASFEAKPVDRLVNDAHIAGEAWKTRTAQAPG